MNRVMFFPLVLVISLALGYGGNDGSSEKRNALTPDLTFLFTCKAIDRIQLEDNMERFLSREGFRVLNKGRLERTRNVFLLDTDIVGLDDHRRIVDVLKLPPADGKYAMRLLSPPPTRHSSQLEDALLEFVRDKLNCELHQVSRNQNGAEAIEFYNSEVKRIEGLFRQAEKLQGRTRT